MTALVTYDIDELCRQESIKLCFVFEVGGPSRVQPRPFTADKVLSDEDVEAAIAVLKHSADEDTIREKMKATFIYRQSMVNNEKRAGDVFSVFPRFLDTPGLVRHLQLFKMRKRQVSSETVHKRGHHTCSMSHHSFLCTVFLHYR